MKTASIILPAALLLLSPFTQAAVIYTDVNPDLVTVPSSTAMFDVDMDNNMIADFRFACVDITGLRFIIAQAGAVGLGNFVLDDTTGGLHNALALAPNAPIGPAQTVWHSMTSTNPTLFSDLFGTFGGLWLGSLDYYLGVQFLIGTNTHFGWIRMHIAQATGIVTLKDYAYEDTPNTLILAGAMPGADIAVNLLASDIANNSSGDDLQLDFDKAANESTVLSYRVIAVKNSIPAFSLADAKAIPSGNYKNIFPSGSNQSVIFGLTFDSDGDPIEIGQEYRLYVLSKAAAGVPDDGLSLPSNAITLNTTTDVATAVTGKDVGNLVNGSDIGLSFTRAVKEAGIFNYRVIILKSADAASFTLTDAQAVTSGRFQDFTPAGSNVQTAMATSLLDKDGDFIQDNIPYKIVVLSMSNGTQANVDSLSAPSGELILTDSPTGIDDNPATSFDFFVNGRFILIDLPEDMDPADFSLFDLNGRRIVQCVVRGRRKIMEVPAGNYIGRLTNGEYHLSKRVMAYE